MSEHLKDIALANATRSQAKHKIAVKKARNLRFRLSGGKNRAKKREPSGLPYSFSEKYKCRPHGCICYNLTCASLRRGASVTKKYPPLRLALLLLCNVLLTAWLLAVIRLTRQNGAYE